MSATELEERPAATSADDDDTVTHIISVDEWERGYIMGEEITALCGYKWVPTKDPNQYPPCVPCLELFEELP